MHCVTKASPIHFTDGNCVIAIEQVYPTTHGLYIMQCTNTGMHIIILTYEQKQFPETSHIPGLKKI